MGLFTLLFGCDAARMADLKVGTSTEAEVRQRLGEPAAIYDEPGGGRTLEYPRLPEGRENFMATIGADGRLAALRQVLTPENFAQVRAGMTQPEVRRLLGRPAKTQVYALTPGEDWVWPFLDGTLAKVFTASFDPSGRIVTTQISVDPKEIDNPTH